MKKLWNCNVCAHRWPGKGRGPSTCPRCRSTLYDRPYEELEGERYNYKLRLDQAVAEFERLQQEHEQSAENSAPEK